MLHTRGAPRQGFAFTNTKPTLRALRTFRLRASSNDNDENLKEKFFGDEQSSSSQGKGPERAAEFSIDSVNPYALGRQARAAFDDLWTQVTRVAQPNRSYIFDDVLQPELESAQSANTTVLVVGATGRVGCILTRKLLLRGYKVRALVRKRDGAREGADGVPEAVELVEGDVGEIRDIQAAMRGVDKVIFCAAARSSFTGDLLRVEDRGVMNAVKAMQDELHRRDVQAGRKHSARSKRELADFNEKYHQLRWDISFVGVPESELSSRDLAANMRGANVADAAINDNNNLVFTGALYTRNAYAEVASQLNPVMPGGEHRTKDTEGICLRIKGDGKGYACVLTTESGQRYITRFPTRMGYLTVRLPYTTFRAEEEGQPPLDPETIRGLALRYENRRAAASGRADEQQFCLEVDWIKALPGGVEPDFVLVSCAGVARPGEDAEEVAKVTGYKRRGEDNLRQSGLGYAIIRPGPLVEEPGGYKALLFDQGSRITQAISYADVADICVRALHETQARNKTFDVCYEYQSEEGLQLYELIAAVPTQGVNYLAPALSTLAKNT